MVNLWSSLCTLGLATTSIVTSIQHEVLPSSAPGLRSYTATAGFPTALFSSYYVPPSPTQQPQPVIFNLLLNQPFPANLTDPKNLPEERPDPAVFPAPLSKTPPSDPDKVYQDAIDGVNQILQRNESSCEMCKKGLLIGKSLAQLLPERVPVAMIELCQTTGFAEKSRCEVDYRANNLGQVWTQVLAYADVAGQDGDYICNFVGTFCPLPPANTPDTTFLFPKPKPKNAKAVAPSGNRTKVLHLSDIHLDPRYLVGAEANCTLAGLCCRMGKKNSDVPKGQQSIPAPLYGDDHCDTPFNLLAAALESIGPLSGVSAKDSFGWTIFTGDMVCHDSSWHLSRAFTEYSETTIFDMIKSYINGPVFPVLGNHDSSPGMESQHALPWASGQQFNWNHKLIASLWQHKGWIDSKTADQARLHYGGYSVKNQLGLRIITLNSDFWYVANIFNFINTTNPDLSGTFDFLIKELQAAEDVGERVWILGHVPTGSDGSNAMVNPSNICHAIIDRYSPHVIANVFVGHTHTDAFHIYYSGTGREKTAAKALTPSWIGPSITPHGGFNPAFRLYEVDTGSFDVMEAYTFIADTSTFASLPENAGPVFKLEYSTRDAYPVVPSWPVDAPLNATFWHEVTVAMEKNHSLVELYTALEVKSSGREKKCETPACAKAKICQMRSSNAEIGRKCPKP